MEEMLTIVDRNRNVLGVKSREAVHRDGDWHETFQCWLIEKQEYDYFIYLQRRSAHKKDFPSLYDITAAGHLMAGETVADGVREMKEELGISVKIEELYFLGAIANTIILSHFIDNEIGLVYLYEITSPPIFDFEDKEVEAIIKILLSDFKQLCNAQLEKVPVQLYERGTFIEGEVIHLSQIVQYEASYMKKVIDGIEAYIEKRAKNAEG